MLPLLNSHSCPLRGGIALRLALKSSLAGLLCALAFSGGCAVSRKHVVKPVAMQPSLSATKPDLLTRYNHLASALNSLTAQVRMTPTAGSALSGVIEQYHEVNGFILAARPASIRVIGQAPVVAKDIFDMVSDGETFRIFIPSKNKFIVGPTALQREAKKPIENLRPQHLFDALLWPEIPRTAAVLLEQIEDPPKRFYILSIAAAASGEWNLSRKIWFDRVDLQVARIQVYGPDGAIISDARYGDWQPAGGESYPRLVSIARPADEYQLEIRITQLTLNQPVPSSRFQLAQPPGTELVQLGEEKQP